MSEMKRYSSVVRIDKREAQDVLNEDDYIVVYEKLDGSNASFRQGEDGQVRSFSRNRELDVNNTLQGFLDYVRRFEDVQLNPQLIYFGEWLVKHKVDYGDNQKEFYLFDLYDTVSESYLPFPFVAMESERLGVPLAPILYAGKYKGYDHLKGLVGRSALATESDKGEGIVIKNNYYLDKYGNQVYIKFVSETFQELQKQKTKPKKTNYPAENEFVDKFVNEARVDKKLRDLIVEGAIPEEFDITDMGTILKALGSIIVEDIIEEESDALPEDYNTQAISRACGRKVPAIIRGIIEKEAAERLSQKEGVLV